MTCLGLELGKYLSKAKIPSQTPRINPNFTILLDLAFSTHKSKGEKGLGTEFYIRFNKESYKEARVRNLPELGEREGNPMTDEEGEDRDLAVLVDLQG